MTDATAGVEPRVLKATRDFLETLANNDAVCGLAVGTHAFRFSDVGQVRTAINDSPRTIFTKTKRRSPESSRAFFQRRTFEFQVETPNRRYSWQSGIGNCRPSTIESAPVQPVTIRLTATRVGAGRPRYVLNASRLGPANSRRDCLPSIRYNPSRHTRRTALSMG